MCANHPSIEKPHQNLRGFVRFGVLVAFALVLTACAQTKLAVYTVKEIAQEAPAGEGVYKVGQPYQIN